MEQFASLKRSKDGQPVRYLVVDDSVFARKNLARIVETFGGQVAGEAGDGMEIKPKVRYPDQTEAAIVPPRSRKGPSVVQFRLCR